MIGKLTRGALLGAAFALTAMAPEDGAKAKAMPELPVAEWTGKPITLEDYRGQLVVVLFFTDSDS